MAPEASERSGDAASDSRAYTNQHYVPQWYQKRFLEPSSDQNVLHYLRLQPNVVQDGHGRRHELPPRRRRPIRKCFVEEDLYTLRFRDIRSTLIEQALFGEIDSRGNAAVSFWADFTHPSADEAALIGMLHYMSAQKLRTPKTNSGEDVIHCFVSRPSSHTLPALLAVGARSRQGGSRTSATVTTATSTTSASVNVDSGERREPQRQLPHGMNNRAASTPRGQPVLRTTAALAATRERPPPPCRKRITQRAVPAPGRPNACGHETVDLAAHRATADRPARAHGLLSREDRAGRERGEASDRDGGAPVRLGPPPRT